MGQYCFARGLLSSSSVVYNVAGGRAGRRVRGRSASAGRARGQSGGRHCTAGQYVYVQSGRYFVLYKVVHIYLRALLLADRPWNVMLHDHNLTKQQ